MVLITEHFVTYVIESECPGSILINFGGEAGLKLVLKLHESGFLQAKSCKILG
jgi:carbamoylphosphate synthase large subunit